ncbi:small integral membrane protein 8-like [Liolophura sinensis]|uniref:small integral membrane protein 8-like n=1 Tax=Liolophura sinensis TaxID=3198878 RepID=UPI0031590219
MAEQQEGTTNKKAPNTYREPGLRNMQTTSLFRAVNFELFAKPNKFTMILGAAAFSGCLGYILYMNMTDDKKSNSYPAVNPDGSLTTRVRTSRWD